MPEVDSLILNVKSDSVIKSAKALEKLESAAKGADKAAGMLSKETGNLGNQQNKTSRSTNDLENNVEELSKDFGRAERSAKKLNGGLSSTTKTIIGMGVAYLSLSAAINSGKFFLTAAADMETLQTSFISLTGSVAEAEKQVRILTDFTASTPFQLEGVATAARQLITARGSTEGLTDQLKILGDISSAANIPIQELAAIYTKSFNKGKIQAEELNQISERGIPIIAQLAAQMGVTREEVFKLGSDGKIAFSDLEKAFISFGQEGGFAFDAMNAQSQTLNGQISTLKDTVGIAAASIGSELAEAFNVSDIIEGMRITAEWIGEIGKTKEELAQAEVDSLNTISEIQLRRVELSEEILEKQRQIDRLANSRNARGRSELQIQQDLLKSQQAQLEGKYLDFSLNERKIAQLNIELEVNEQNRQSIKDQAAERNIAENRARAIRGEQLVAQTELTQKEQFRISLLDNGDKILRMQLKTVQDIITEANKPTPAINQALVDDFTSVENSLRTQGEIINDQFEKRRTAIIAYQGTLEGAASLTEDQVNRIDQALNRAEAVRNKALANLPLSQGGMNFLVDLPDIELPEGDSVVKKIPTRTRPTPTRPTPTRRASSRSTRPSGPSEFDRLKESLQREESIIEQSYLSRLELIRKNTTAGSELRKQLEGKIKAQYDADNAEFSESLVDRSSLFAQSLEAELTTLQDHFDKKRKLVLENEQLTENEKQALIASLGEQQNATARQIQSKRNAELLSSHSEMLGNLAAISQAFGKKGARVAKALAISQATINAYLGFSNALSDPSPMPTVVRWGLAGASLATGLANVANIQSTGNYANGGIIPGNSFAGDNLQANVNSGEMVLNKMQQANLFKLANNPKPNRRLPNQGQASNNGNLNITVLPTAGTTADVKQDPTNPQNIEIILRRVDEKLTSDLQTGGGQFIPALTTRVPALRQA